ncbi:MAG: tRNA-dihydrouridine synthase, partial [Acetobacteraceae bacterium]|nr:tRNA-dihydrouridine synthase [Acetobacteraceae bacterium]
FLRTGSRLAPPPLARQEAIMLGHFHAMLSYYGTETGLRLARKHLCWYVRGLPGAAQFRADVQRLESEAEVEELIRRFFEPLIARGVVRETGDAAPDEDLLAA